jgi:hypothetical protein
MLEGMLLAIVIVALAQLPWLVWLFVRERPESGGGGGGTKRDEIPPQPPREPDFDWSSFEDDFRAYAAWTRWTTPVKDRTDVPAADPTGRTDPGGSLSG